MLEFSFAHRGRNGDDTLKLTITDLGADNAVGGGDDQELFAKQYTTGKDAWAVYDSTTEPAFKALGNKIRFAYIAVYATGGKGPGKTEGNFLEGVNPSCPFGTKRPIPCRLSRASKKRAGMLLLGVQNHQMPANNFCI